MQPSLSDQVFSRTAGAELSRGNEVRLLVDAAENYPAWLDAINSARRYVHFENYILHEDEVGKRFSDAFIKKASEGVPVRIVYDWVGCIGRASRGFWRRLQEGGVHVRSFNPPRLDQPIGWVARDHRKCLVVDGQVAFVTGLCVGKMWEGTPERGLGPWRDTGVAIRGPAVAEVALAFEDSWAATGRPLSRDESSTPDSIQKAGEVDLRVVASTPGSASLYRLDPLVASLARRTLWLSDAYFAGISVYVQALRAAAQDGVDVRLLVPGPGSDIPMMQRISRAGYRGLLHSGVRVFEWNGPMMHAKTAVADARWARVGSSNLNMSSWFGNRELDIVIENEDFGRAMEEMFVRDLSNSTEIVFQTRRRIRPLAGTQVAGPRRAGSRGTRAAAGAMRIGNAIGSVLAAHRVHHPGERRLMGQASAFFGGLALVAFAWPRLLAWPLGAVSLWLALALLVNALRRKRAVDSGSPGSSGAVSEAAEPKEESTAANRVAS